MFPSPNLRRQATFAELRARGAATAVVGFDGGNDEGGPHSIKLLDANGSEIADLDPYPDYVERNGRWEPDTPDGKLAEALAAPIEAQYGSFAGDFYVSGKLTWDVTTGAVVMDKQEQSGYDHSTYEV